MSRIHPQIHIHFLLVAPVIESKMLHHLMIGTWTPPGRIYTVVFDDEVLTLTLVKKTEIPEDEPISWMTFDVCLSSDLVRHEKSMTSISMRRKISTAPP
jgi:carboxy-cis,cis-muconate cyclase